ncbi:type I-F CRISPR-associated protein Csy2 [Acinetobacter baumannii]|uniref:type I-F CRISPR-associated protein Csy2 n=1 Tax=Acinetobacter baumannii TaxID=470 RepID=UPI002AFC6D14|nr:type I-F CRISPR-associated protein Csy2 [Acinetobacter baumannii]
MTSYILLEKIKVEDANCIAGITYGFPAITNFLGFTHALSRKFSEEFGVELIGCAIFSHDYVLRTNEQYDVRFIQSKRPPVMLQGQKYRAEASNTPPIIEEGKMDLTVSLLLQSQEPLSSVETVKQAYKRLLTKCIYQARLAGGSIQDIKNISFWGDGLDLKKLKRKLLPSFVLIDAQQELKKHFEENQKLELNKEVFDLWTDFFAYKASAKQKEDGSVEWIRHEKPNPRGWYVPLMIGYKGISPLYEGYEIENNRDPNYPFRFVESVHGIGEWRSSHRIDDIDSLIWKYHIEDEWYLCRQNTLDMQYLENIEQPQPISSTIDPLDF